MASDDRWGDAEPDEAPEALSVREVARRKVRWPAFGLILLGLIWAGGMTAALAFRSGLPAYFQEVRREIRASPDYTADQKVQLLEIVDVYERDSIRLLPVVAPIGVAVGLFLILAGVRLLALTGRGMGMTAAVVGMLPISITCCLGLPIGVWALFALNRPDVRAGFAAEARRRRGPDTLDDEGF